MQRFNIRWLALLAITLIAIYLCWLIVLPFLDVIIWSVVLAVVAFPFYERVRRRVTSPKWAASLITVLAIIVVGLLPIAVLAITAVSQVPEGIQATQDGLDKFKHFLAGNSRMAGYVHHYLGIQDTGDVTDQLKSVAQPAITRSLSIAGGVFTILIKVAFTLFALFYLLRDADAVSRATINLLPLDEAQSKRVFQRCRDVIKASVQGVMVIAAVQGLIGGVMFAGVGLPSPILWGFVMFITALVPAIGSAIVWLPAAGYLALSGHYWKAAVIVFIGGVVVSSIDNLLRPKLVGEKAGLHDLVIFFSVLGGLQAFGVAGLFVGPVVVALTLAIIEVFRQMNPVGPNTQHAPKVLVASDGTELLTP